MLPYNLLLGTNLFTDLPQEVTINILSRLPVGSIKRCKCVCKSWRDLIDSSEFAMTHLSKWSSSSSSGLALIEVSESPSKPYYKICEEVGVDGCTTISNFCLPTHDIQDSTGLEWLPCTTKLSCADGLLLLFDGRSTSFPNLFICNPITREYIELPPPGYIREGSSKFGFGASKVTGQYKVVLIFKKPLPFVSIDDKSHDPVCMVYTLGTDQLWRRVEASKHGRQDNIVPLGALLNGNLHWLRFHLHQLLISCFDLETEKFTSFSLPPCDYAARGYWSYSCGRYWLSALEGRLCLCDHVAYDKIVIWLMNKYGDGNSWIKEFIINTSWPARHHYLNDEFVFPIYVSNDSGDILFGLHNCEQLFFYSNKSKTIQEYSHLQVHKSYYSSSFVNYTPSFLSLKAMGLQNVSSF